MIRFDSRGGALIGAPFRLTRFDSAAEIMAPDVYSSQIGIGTGRAVLEVATIRGSIWLLDNADRENGIRLPPPTASTRGPFQTPPRAAGID
jgi:hypothetical protein